MKFATTVVVVGCLIASCSAVLSDDVRVEAYEEFKTTIPDDERVEVNFVKVLSAIFVRRTPVPKEVRTAARTMMKGILNNQIERDGYKSYLLTSLLRVVDSKPDVQVVSMLNIVENQSPNESHLSSAAKILLEWFKTQDGKKFLDEISQYIRSLFQKVGRIVSRPKQPSILGSLEETHPESIIGSTNEVDTQERVELARNRIPSDYFPQRIKRNPEVAHDLENKLYDNTIKIEIDSDERRKPNRPGNHRPGQQRPGQGPPRDRYPDDNHHYPEDNHHPQRPPNHYPEDNHGRPRPPNRFPEDNHRPPHRPTHPGGPPQHYPDRNPYPPNHPNHPQKICFEKVDNRYIRSIEYDENSLVQNLAVN